MGNGGVPLGAEIRVLIFNHRYVIIEERVGCETFFEPVEGDVIRLETPMTLPVGEDDYSDEEVESLRVNAREFDTEGRLLVVWCVVVGKTKEIDLNDVRPEVERLKNEAKTAFFGKMVSGMEETFGPVSNGGEDQKITVH